MRSEAVVEKRTWQRLPISFPLFARGHDYDGTPFRELVTAVNASAGGLLVAISRRCIPVSPVLLEMPIGGISSQGGLSRVQEMLADVMRTAPHRRWNLLALKLRLPLRPA